jgi:hypothetical protein
LIFLEARKTLVLSRLRSEERGMSDWTQDPKVITAIREFESARDDWLRVAPDDGILRTDASPMQDIAFSRMRTADRAYVWARDNAIGQATWNSSDSEPASRWPQEVNSAELTSPAAVGFSS